MCGAADGVRGIHGWGRKTYYTQLWLDTLLPESAPEFLQALLGDDPSLRPSRGC
jgi:hypothetical protein